MVIQNYIKTKYEVPNNARRFRLNGILRKDLYVLFKELGFTTGCEVGVCQGKNAKVMLDTIPGLKLYCIDSWPSQNDYRKTQRNLREYSKQVKIIRKSSLEVVRNFKELLDFVYIDADHSFDFVMRDIIEWSNKVRVGGIVSGHDYFRFPEFGVVTAVNAYVKEHRIKPWFVLDNERSEKIIGRNSWFWVKNES